MKIHEAKASCYDSVVSECVYDYMRKYVTEIYNTLEPVEDGTGNSYKEKQKHFASKDRTQLKAIAASLETICKRLDAMEGKY